MVFRIPKFSAQPDPHVARLRREIELAFRDLVGNENTNASGISENAANIDEITSGSSTVDHGALIGLADDDHTQYQLRSEQGAASGYPTLDVNVRLVEAAQVLYETGGTSLSAGAVADGFLIARSGTSYVGVDPASLTGIDHGSLAGLSDDDHTQYLRTDGTRDGTGDQLFAGRIAAAGADHTDGVAGADDGVFGNFSSTSGVTVCSSPTGQGLFVFADAAGLFRAGMRYNHSTEQLQWIAVGGQQAYLNSTHLQLDVNLTVEGGQASIGDFTGTATIEMRKDPTLESIIRFRTVTGVHTLGDKRILHGTTETLTFEHYNGASWEQMLNFNGPAQVIAVINSYLFYASGDIQGIGDLFLNSATPTFTTGDGTGQPTFVLNKGAANSAQINWYDAGVRRWIDIVDGSENRAWYRYDAAGVYLDTPLYLEASTGRAWINALQIGTGASTVIYESGGDLVVQNNGASEAIQWITAGGTLEYDENGDLTVPGDMIIAGGLGVGGADPSSYSASTDFAVQGDSVLLGEVSIGDPGFEQGSIAYVGTTFDAILKVNDFGGGRDACIIAHRHSTVDGANVLLTRSNSNTSAHAAVTNGMEIGRLMWAGHDGTDYNPIAEIRAYVDDTVATNDVPGRLEFYTTPDGTNAPALALTIDMAQDAVFTGRVAASGAAFSDANAGADDGVFGTNAVAQSSGVTVVSDNLTSNFQYFAFATTNTLDGAVCYQPSTDSMYFRWGNTTRLQGSGAVLFPAVASGLSLGSSGLPFLDAHLSQDLFIGSDSLLYHEVAYPGLVLRNAADSAWQDLYVGDLVANSQVFVNNSAGIANSSADEVTIGSTGSPGTDYGLTIFSNDVDSGFIMWGDSSDSSAAWIEYDNNNNRFAFAVNSTAELLLESAQLRKVTGGNLGLGSNASPFDFAHINNVYVGPDSKTQSAHASANEVVIGDTGGTGAQYGLSILTDATGYASVLFGDAVDNDAGRQVYDFSNNRFLYYVESTLMAQLTTTAFAPGSDGGTDSGTNTIRWGTTYSDYYHVTNYIEYEATSEPGAPGSNENRVYSDTADGHLKTKQNDGTVHILDTMEPIVLNVANVSRDYLYTIHQASGTAATHGEHATPHRQYVSFPNEDSAEAVWCCYLPLTYSGKGLEVELHIAGSTGSATDATFEVSIERMVDGQDMSGSSFAAANSVNITMNATAERKASGTVTFTDGADMDSLAAGECFRILIARPTGDTYAGDVRLYRAVINETY